MAIVEPNRDAEVMEQRRRHWLGIICAGLLLTIGLATWWHVEDPFNPYRDGTTHAATLVYENPPCLNSWGTSADGGKYVWQVAEGVPESFGNGPVAGRLHIIRQRSSFGGVSATFQAQGQTILLTGGREPVFFYASCSIR